jgi:hypothetical protein
VLWPLPDDSRHLQYYGFPWYYRDDLNADIGIDGYPDVPRPPPRGDLAVGRDAIALHSPTGKTEIYT